MKVIPQKEGSRRDRESLVTFLRGCREEARQDGRYRIASISLRVNRIDPLAVLESIFDPAELHFYLERSGHEEAVAGAGAVAAAFLHGTGRFGQAKEFVEDLLERSICIGDVDAAFAGPHIFCAFTFLDEPGDEPAFPGATLFLPRWQVARRGDSHTASANLRVDPDSDVEELAGKVWQAHQKFSAFEYGRVGKEDARPAVSPSVDVRPGTSRECFERMVEEALQLIEAGRLEKVVLARFLEVELPAELNPLHALNRLRNAYSNCFTYSVANGRGQSFIGASPELLLRRRGDQLETEALAGSAPRGRTAAEDASFAEQLLRSNKDQREHRFVVDSIRRRLDSLPVSLEAPDQPRLFQLANVQHLRTPIGAGIPPDVHLMDILAALHPTPAVGGTPRAEACAAIRRLENFDRGLYAGAVGWIDGRREGQFTVAIRSTLVNGRVARVFAGAGIVEGSMPRREWSETEVKLRAILEVLG